MLLNPLKAFLRHAPRKRSSWARHSRRQLHVFTARAADQLEDRSLLSGYSVVHSFSPSTDGEQPQSVVAVSGSTIYGTTGGGGPGSGGTIFSVNTDGTDFTVLYSFSKDPTGAAIEGYYPAGDLVLSGSTLYGVAEGEPPFGYYGAIYSINTDGSGFTVLHTFDSADGGSPQGQLLLSGSTLYGTTAVGGQSSDTLGAGEGTVFKINTDGTGFTTLHSFAADGSEGAEPIGTLALSGSTLYGAAYFRRGRQ